MSVYAIIAAGGLGTRMKLGAGQSKQYLKLSGKPLLTYTLAAFEAASRIDKIAVATGADYIPALRSLVKRNRFGKVDFITPGGRERQDSIYHCIELLAEELADASVRDYKKSVILIHDGARAFIQPEEIDEIVRLTQMHGAAIPATKLKDTVKEFSVTAQHGKVCGKTLERGSLVQVQTPQGFLATEIIAAHRAAQQEGIYATDDAALIERYFPKRRIFLYEMGYHNLKVTTPEDLAFGLALLKQRRAEKR